MALFNIVDYLIDKLFIILFHIIKLSGLLLKSFQLSILFFVFISISFVLFFQRCERRLLLFDLLLTAGQVTLQHIVLIFPVGDLLHRHVEAPLQVRVHLLEHLDLLLAIRPVCVGRLGLILVE